MADKKYTAFDTLAYKGEIDLDTATVKAALMNASHTFNPDHDGWADISANEVSAGTGYTSGGKVVTGLTVTSDDANDEAVINCDDIVWTGATISNAYSVVLYVDSHASKCLLSHHDFGAAKSCTEGTFTVTIDASGIVATSNA